MDEIEPLNGKQSPKNSLKRETSLEINENTDGFITQVLNNNDETKSQHSIHNNNNNNELETKSIETESHTTLKNEKKKNKKKKNTPQLNPTKSFVSFDKNITEKKISDDETEETNQRNDNNNNNNNKLLPTEPSLIVPNLDDLAAMTSFVNPEHTISFIANSTDLKEMKPATTPFLTAKLQSMSLNGQLKPNVINRNSNNYDKSNFSKAFQFLPNILSDNNQFPNRKNFHHKRIFLRYLTNKIEKENEFASIVKSNLTAHSSRSNLISSKSTGKSARKVNYLVDDSGAYYEDQQIFVDLKKASSPPPSQMERYANRLKHQSSNLTQANLRSKSLINSIDKKSTTAATDDDTRSNYTRPFAINSVKNVVDLNVISDSSRLSGHYLEMVQNKKRLADLNLNEMWPKSRMYKVSIKANPWVNSFKAKTHANEVNLSFRSTLESGYTTNSRSNTAKRNVSLLPNIKQML